MLLTSWNCRGLGHSSKAEAVKNLMKLAPFDLLLLRDTKIEEDALLLISKNKWNMTSSKAVSVRGSCGGLATLWCKDNFQLINEYVTQHWIFSELFHNNRKITFALFNLYVLVNYEEKKYCWQLIFDFLELHSPANIFIAGDLNLTLAPIEKKGGAHGKDFMQDAVEKNDSRLGFG